MLQSAQPSFGPLGLSGRGSSSGMLHLLVVAHWCGHNDGASQGAKIEKYLLLPLAISVPPEWNLDRFLGQWLSPQYQTRDSWQETTTSGHPMPSTMSKSLEMEEKPLPQLQPFLDRLTVSSFFSIDQGVDFVEASGL